MPSLPAIPGLRAFAVALGLLAALAVAPGPLSAQAESPSAAPFLALGPCQLPGLDDPTARCGVYQVFENRRERTGKVLPLRVVVLPARSIAGTEPRPEPVFFLFGGPGETASENAQGFVDSWLRERHDVVLVDQRGTGEGHRLDCTEMRVSERGEPGSELQAYLEPFFEARVFRACRQRLEAEGFDLTRYTTDLAVNDLDEIRRALGYETIHIMGGSYGSRAGLEYLRRHGDHVKAAVLNGIAPPAFKNPLYHAREAQRAFDLLVAECEAEPACAAAYPDLHGDLETVLERLAAAPARVEVRDPRALVEAEGNAAEGAAPPGSHTVLLDRDAFADGLRVFLYNGARGRQLPLLLHRAAAGDLAPFAEMALAARGGLLEALRFGLLLSVVCNEDVPRIEPWEIPRETVGTFLGDRRVRDQMAACVVWPRSQEVPPEVGKPVTADVPVLLLSGHLDPVTSPTWAEEAERHLPRGHHLIFPGGHALDEGHPCLRKIISGFLEQASLEGIDTGCLEEMELPPFALPEPTAPTG